MPKYLLKSEFYLWKIKTAIKLFSTGTCTYQWHRTCVHDILHFYRKVQELTLLELQERLNSRQNLSAIARSNSIGQLYLTSVVFTCLLVCSSLALRWIISSSFCFSFSCSAAIAFSWTATVSSSSFRCSSC